MSEYDIVKCRICGTLIKRYRHCVYPGDSSACQKCNEKVKDL